VESLNWAIAALSIALADWPAALGALEGALASVGVPAGVPIKASPTTVSVRSLFGRCTVPRVQVWRAYVLALLETNRPCEALRVALQAYDDGILDAEMALHAADALVCLNLEADPSNTWTLESLLRSAVSQTSRTCQSSSTSDAKRCRSGAGSESGLLCVALNNQALLFAAKGCTVQACHQLRRALLVCGPDEHRPAFNLALLLWKSMQCEEASNFWISWRFREETSRSGVCLLDVCLDLLQEAQVRRASCAETEQPSNAHVCPRGAAGPAISQIQLCLLDILLLEYKYTALQSLEENQLGR